ncbi:hypothetical protein NPIL_656151, partial [Nephila pilipes]
AKNAHLHRWDTQSQTFRRCLRIGTQIRKSGHLLAANDNESNMTSNKNANDYETSEKNTDNWPVIGLRLNIVQ